MNSTTLHTLIDLVKRIPDLHITGSYAFSNVKHSSDIDFFVDYYKDVDNQLNSLEFKVESPKLCYNDSQVVAIYKHVEANIHVQVVKDAEKKMKAQLFLLSLPAQFRYDLNTAEKSTRREIWNWVYKVIDNHDSSR